MGLILKHVYLRSNVNPNFSANPTDLRFAASQVGFHPLSKQSKMSFAQAALASPFLRSLFAISTSISIPFLNRVAVDAPPITLPSFITAYPNANYKKCFLLSNQSINSSKSSSSTFAHKS